MPGNPGIHRLLTAVAVALTVVTGIVAVVWIVTQAIGSTVNAVLAVVLGAVAALIVGSAAVLASARKHLRAARGAPRSMPGTIGRLFVGWTGVGLALLVLYVLILLVGELDQLLER
ncbi:MAG: hypothetical protein ABR575_01235 [Actinomycetota bacterium]